MRKYIILSIYASPEIGENIFIFNTLSTFLNEFHTSSIFYVVVIMTSKGKQQSAYWHFNVSLLNDKIYVDIIINFWRKWQEMLCDYDDIRMWWDIGNIKIKELSQQYSIGLKNYNFRYQNLFESQIKKYEESLIVCKSKIVFDNLRRCKIELESIIKD